MNWTLRTAIASMVAAFAIGLMSGPLFAAPPGDRGFVAPPESSTFDNVIDAAEMEALVDINERIEQHLTIDAEGLVQLDANVTAAELGVDEGFLETYREALAESNKLIERGEITVDADMRVTATERFAQVSRPGLPGPGGATLDGMEGEGSPEPAVPDWSVWNYNTGSMYYNSYNTYNTYRNNYYSLCNSMAAYQRCSSCGASLQYFYTYNSSYNNNYCNSNSGLYYYLPYSNGNSCGSSRNSCYGNLGYKPVYYWGSTRTYNYSCRCYQQQYQWNGYWGRY